MKLGKEKRFYIKKKYIDNEDSSLKTQKASWKNLAESIVSEL